jgi:hypothetical protein
MSSSRLTNIPVLIRQKARTASGCGSTTNNKDWVCMYGSDVCRKNEEMSGESYVKTCREGRGRVERCVGCVHENRCDNIYVCCYICIEL